MSYLLIVLQGPSASGKSTLQAGLGLPRIVTWTSRPPRVGEKDGVDYYFAPRERMQAMDKAGELLEMTEYQGNYYGTALKTVSGIITGGEVRSVVLDAAGAKKVKTLFPKQVLLVGVYAEKEECRRRMSTRSVPDSELERRLAGYEEEVKALFQCDLIISNTDEHAGQARELLEGISRELVGRQ
ncbi:MAG: guanylate kinase [Paenibacillaceae bacterium]|jgi:guanylate kinase|nr:guanylate kinase [Paenibacillaceae bacterium]